MNPGPDRPFLPTWPPISRFFKTFLRHRLLNVSQVPLIDVRRIRVRLKEPFPPFRFFSLLWLVCPQSERRAGIFRPSPSLYFPLSTQVHKGSLIIFLLPSAPLGLSLLVHGPFPLLLPFCLKLAFPLCLWPHFPPLPGHHPPQLGITIPKG